ncbi:MAG: hypothetical protein J7J38_02310, partial [Candidatus Aenigmarchaeota archaeon]|nr:hypothetical protein [Candidatus Aenigmarchaeota archaeon]
YKNKQQLYYKPPPVVAPHDWRDSEIGWGNARLSDARVPAFRPQFMRVFFARMANPFSMRF